MEGRNVSMQSLKFNSAMAWTQIKDGEYDDLLLEQFFIQFKEFHLIIFEEKLTFILDNLFMYINPLKTNLVNLYSQFLVCLIKQNTKIRFNQECFNWFFKTLEETNMPFTASVLTAFQSLISVEGASDILLKDVESLFKRKSLLLRHIDSHNRMWDEKELQVLHCFNTILSKLKKQDHFIQPKISIELKTVVLETLSKLPINDLDKIYINKVVKVCLRLLRLTVDVKILKNSEEFGVLLGIAQAYLFYEIPGFPIMNPKAVIRCNLNLPIEVDSNLKKKYFRNHRTKKPFARKKEENKSLLLLSPAPKALGMKSQSDSETSDCDSRGSEGGAPLDRKIRLEAAHLLNDIVQSNSREFTGFWMQIVASDSRDGLRTLAKYVVRETAQANRTVVLSTLNELLLASKVFLSHANDIERSSFDSVFYLLGLSIKELHLSVRQLLAKENRILPLVQALKCASALVEATPFSRLKPGLASELAKLCYPFLTNKDNTVKVKAFEFFETLILSEPVTQEVYDIFAKSLNDSLYTLRSDSICKTASETELEEIVIDDDNEAGNLAIDTIQDDMNSVQESSKMGAIIKVCLKTFTIDKTREPVMLRAIMLIRAIAFNAFDLVYPHLEYATKKLFEPTMCENQDEQSRVALQAVRTLEVIAQHLKVDEYCNDKALAFWKTTIPNVIFLMGYKSAAGYLREAACDCLANIDDNVLMRQMNIEVNNSKSNSQYLIASIVSALSWCAKDEESAVRAAALRAFGILVTLPALEENTGFLWDVHACACQGYEDENLGVRIKAAWAMANLSETLIKRKNKIKAKFNVIVNGSKDSASESKSDPNEPEPIDFVSILAKPYLLSVSGARDKDKVRCNAVRTIGNIIYLCEAINVTKDYSKSKVEQDKKYSFDPYDSVEVQQYVNTTDSNKTVNKDISEKINERFVKDNQDNVLRDTTDGLNALIDCLQKSNDMKVKWNACRAIGIILSGNPDVTLPPFWKDIVFLIVTDQMCRCPNFKVRTNAAWVLTVCKSFGDEISLVWKRVMEAFENSKTLSNVNEYQHYEALVEQLCLAFCHVAVLTDSKWFDSLCVEVENHFDSVAPIIRRFQEKVLPEKAGELIEAKTRFSVLAQKEMNPKERQFVKKMVEIFENHNRFDNETLT